MTGKGRKHPADRSGSVVALFGMAPGGKKLASAAAGNGVALLSGINELQDLAAKSNGAYRTLHSIVVVVCPGDDLSIVPDIYTLAVQLHILITAIIVTGPDNHVINGAASAILQGASDIIVNTSDATCLQHLLETMVG